MPFNRIGGFYVGGCIGLEAQTMSIDDQNREVNEALDCRLSQLNAAIEAHEKALKAMTIARDVIHQYDEGYDFDGTCMLYSIGMIKWRGTWRLCHDTAVAEEVEEDEYYWKPLVDCSIADRLRAADPLDEFREKVVEAKKELIPVVEAAIKTLVKSPEAFDEKGTS